VSKKTEEPLGNDLYNQIFFYWMVTSRTTHVRHPFAAHLPPALPWHDKDHYRPLKPLVTCWGDISLGTFCLKPFSTFALLEFPQNMHSLV
jgi:hypothetical protein